MALIATVLLLLAASEGGHAAVEEVRLTLQVISLVRDLGKEVAKAVEVYEESDAKDQHLLNSVERLSAQVDAAASRSEAAAESVASAHLSLPTLVRSHRRLDALLDTVGHVDSLFRQMAHYTKGQIERHTLEDLAHSVVSHGHGSVRSKLASLHHALLGQPAAKGLDAGLLDLFRKAVKVTTING